MSTRAFLNKIKAGALLGWQKHRILPSITGAQGVLEGASGTSKLAQPPYNNQFGIKAGAGWTGRTVSMATQEWVGGRYITVNADFRAYDSIDESVADHAAFFTNTEWRKNNYRHVVGEKDYKKASRALQSAGYATDPGYANKLIRIIEQYGLQKWDEEAFSGNNVANNLLRIETATYPRPPMIDRRTRAMGYPSNGAYKRRSKSDIKNIVWHYSATMRSGSTEDVMRGHENYWRSSHGWDIGGYHYFIGRDGTILWNYDLEISTYGASGANPYSMHICCEASGTNYTQAQIDARNNLTLWLLTNDLKHLNGQSVRGHKEMPGNNTPCPGYSVAQLNTFRNDLDAQLNRTVTAPVAPIKKTVGGALSNEARDAIKQVSLTVVGDSLGVGTQSYLTGLGWKSINQSNKGSRQWSHSDLSLHGLNELKKFRDAGTIGDYVVMILGTNRGVRDDEIATAVGYVGRSKLILVDTDSQVGHKGSVASAYKRASEQYSNVFYANWSSYARAEWYGSDNIHMTGTGYRNHAEFIAQAVYETTLTRELAFSSDNMVTTEREQAVFGRYDIKSLEYKDEVFHSPLGESVIYNPSLNDRFGFQTRSGDVLWIDHVLNVNSDDQNEILEAGLEFMRKNGQPNAQYTINLKSMPKELSIGDTGMFIDHEFEPPLYIQARILEINESLSNPDVGSVVVGNVQEVQSLTDTKILDLQKDLQKTRDELVHDLFYGGDIEINITSSKGSAITNNGLIKERELIKRQTTLTEVLANDALLLEVDTPSANGVNEFYFSGRIQDNIIKSEPVEPILIEDDTEFIPEGISDGYNNPNSLVYNPQGQSVMVPDEDSDSHSLIVDVLLFEFIDYTDNVAHSEEIAIHHDSSFYRGIPKPNVTFKAIRISTPKDIVIEDISFKEPARVSDKAASTELHAVVLQNDRDITGRYDHFLWTRISDDDNADLLWNDSNKFNHTPKLDITPEDINGVASTFVLTALDDDGLPEVGGYYTIAINREFDAYEIAVSNGFVGTRYEWAETLKETDTGKGVPVKTENNELAYLHTAWADAVDGRGFSLEYYDGAKYMGSYISTQEDDSTDHSEYTWIRVQGQDGKPGADGRTPYTHIAYASSADGSVRFSTSDPTDRIYMGMYTDFNSADSQDYTKYKWMLVKGERGEKGKDASETRNFFIANTLPNVGEDFTHPNLPEGDWKVVKINAIKGKEFTLKSDFEPLYLHDEGELTKIPISGLVALCEQGYFEVVYLEEVEDEIADMKAGHRVYVHEHTEEALPWEPSIEDTIYLGTVEIRDELARKANAEYTEAFLNELKVRAESLLQEQEALATKEEVNDFLQAYRSFLDVQHKDKAQAERALSSALGRMSELENELGDLAVRWKFIDKEISMSEEGLIIGHRDAGTYLLQSEDRIGFYNNGVEVAFISAGVLQITQAVFLRQIQIGNFIISEGETDHLTFRYVGDEKHGV